MRPRIVTSVVCLLDAVAWAIVAYATFGSGSDPATLALAFPAVLALLPMAAVTAFDV